MQEPKQRMQAVTDYFLDICGETCPMTFVRARLMVDRMSSGQTLEIRLREGEPLVNVPRALAELGHEVGEPRADAEAGVYRLTIRKA